MRKFTDYIKEVDLLELCLKAHKNNSDIINIRSLGKNNKIITVKVDNTHTVDFEVKIDVVINDIYK